jgi:hypothetical protein
MVVKADYIFHPTISILILQMYLVQMMFQQVIYLIGLVGLMFIDME